MSFDPTLITIVFLAGTLSGFINVMAGGGSALTVPLLIFIGFDPSVANGTNRVAILVEAASGVAAFKRENHAEFALSLKLSAFTLPGAILGAIYAVKIDDALFQKVLAVVMIFIVISIMLPTTKANNGNPPDGPQNYLLYPVMLGVGFYGGFIQAGVGFLIMATLRHLMNFNLVRVNVHKMFIVFIYTLPVIFVFIGTGNVSWFAALVLSAGTATGAWWSAKISIRKGDKAVRAALAVALILISIKLFLST